MSVQFENLLKCPLEMIDEPKLMDAVKDYNANLKDVAEIADYTHRTAVSVAIEFTNRIRSLTDEQADKLQSDTIEFYNFLLTDQVMPEDFMPSIKMFPTLEQIEQEKKESQQPQDDTPVDEHFEPAPEPKKTRGRKPKLVVEPSLEELAKQFENPTATTATVMMIVDGCRNAKEIVSTLAGKNLLISKASVDVILTDVRKALNYLLYKEKKANAK